MRIANGHGAIIPCVVPGAGCVVRCWCVVLRAWCDGPRAGCAQWCGVPRAQGATPGASCQAQAAWCGAWCVVPRRGAACRVHGPGAWCMERRGCATFERHGSSDERRRFTVLVVCSVSSRSAVARSSDRIAAVGGPQVAADLHQLRACHDQIAGEIPVTPAAESLRDQPRRRLRGISQLIAKGAIRLQGACLVLWTPPFSAECAQESNDGVDEKHDTFSKAFREEAVRQARESRRPLTTLARDFGVNYSTLWLWVKQAGVALTAHRPGRGSGRGESRVTRRESASLGREAGNRKKSDGLLRETQQVKLRFMTAEKAHDPVALLGGGLFVGGSGVDAWRMRRPSRRAEY